MKKSSRVFKVGTRASKLARLQTHGALERLGRLLPGPRFEEAPLSTPGDRDLRTDLRASPADFFTRDLDQAVLAGALDAAVHSAKDLPDPVPPGLDWCWLPWREDPRDVLVVRRGFALADLTKAPVIGVSSVRREEYCRRRFPDATLKPARGAIEDRIRQLDAGDFDVMVLAAAGLARLGLAERIAEWIPLSDLPTPPGQGALSVTFRAGDRFWRRIRSLLVHPVVFAGAGSGSAETCTLGALEAIARCGICFHDSLLDAALLERLPRGAECVDVGKRCGNHNRPQAEIDALLTAAARRGQRVLRLKGGDPGIFGRLSEEIAALDALGLPYRVIPGVSSLNSATTGTGMLLTQRGIARGFTVMTPRRAGGGTGSVGAEARAQLPLVFFMGLEILGEIVAQLRAEGLPESTPAAVVFAAGSFDERVARGCLSDIELKIAGYDVSSPGLVVVGSPAEHGYHTEWGALRGKRILVTCSAALQGQAAEAVRDFGGVPVALPLIQTIPDPACLAALKSMAEFDWLAVTSPSSVHVMMRLMRETGLDLRRLPKFIVAGPGTSEALKSYGIWAELVPARNFGAEGLLDLAKSAIPAGAAILRLRSQLAGSQLTAALAAAGYRATDCVLYANQAIRPERAPAFDAVFFASASAVDAFVALAPAVALAGKMVAAIGGPTRAALEKHGVRVDALGAEATAPSAIETLAAIMVRKEWEELT
ncbi:MAG: uroporphyrinogen-III C-methyltransferase [Kiritimatiellia bacterium]|jgi:uroporphyrinogen III methyltransferase/synthase